MEQNEMFENNGFENVEDQEKYKSVILAKQKKADLCAKISFITLVLGCCVPYFTNIICYRLTKEPIGETSGNMKVKIVAWCVAGILYLISLVACISGRIIMRTKKIKGIFAIHILSILGIFVSWLFLYGFVYLIFGWFK